MSVKTNVCFLLVNYSPYLTYRVYQPNFPIDSNKITNGYGEIWLIDPVNIPMFNESFMLLNKH